MSTAKSYNISKLPVWEAYQRVKASRRAAERGTGGRITVESVAEYSWNRWPDGRGIRSSLSI